VLWNITSSKPINNLKAPFGAFFLLDAIPLSLFCLFLAQLLPNHNDAGI
jgi:hypothetical protein